jgi:hypothetical protein
MYVLTDESGDRLLAEAETVAASRLAARTMHDEGTELPILITLGDRIVERYEEGRYGPLFRGSTLSRSLR